MFVPKLGVSLHTISNEVTDEVLEAIGSSRIVTLEVKPWLFAGERGADRKAALLEMLQSTGIRVASIHIPTDHDYELSSLDDAVRRAAMDEAERCIDLAVELSVPLLVAHASDDAIEPAERADRLKRSRDALVELTSRSRRHNLRIAVELLPRTCLGNTAEEVLDIIRPLDSEVFGVCLDTNHLMDRYRTLPDVVRELGENLIALHLSDYDGVDEKHQLPGTGVIDWKGFMAALREIDYGGPFDYECRWKDLPLPERIRSLEENFDWLGGL